MPLPVFRRASLVALRRFLAVGILISVMRGAICMAGTPVTDYLIDPCDTDDEHPENNLPNSTVTCIAQTWDRYLWVGTYGGLARFDGVRFITFDHFNQPAIGHSRIQGLYVDAEGTLWVSTFRGGLTSCRGLSFKQEWPDDPFWYDLHTRLAWSSSNTVVFVTQLGDVLKRTGTNALAKVATPPGGMRLTFQCADKDGWLWFLTREGHIMRFNAEFEELADGGGLGNKRVWTLVKDPGGKIWAGAENEIAYWDGTRFQNMTPTNNEGSFEPSMLFPTRSGAIWVLASERLRKMEGRQWTAEPKEWRGQLGWVSGRAMGAHEDRDGGVWFNHYGNGLFYITPDGHYQRPGMAESTGERIGAWYQSYDTSIWIGLDRGGLARVRDRRFRFHALGPGEGLPARTALSVCQDKEGSVWIGTSGDGVFRWNTGKLNHYLLGSYPATNFVFSIFPRNEGGVWVSAGEGEDLFILRDDGRFQRAPWEVHGVKSILTDRSGRVWLGTKANLSWWSTNGPNGRRAFGTNDGMRLSAVRAIAEAPDGTVWSGADDGTLYRCEPDRLQAFRADDSLAGQPILSLWADKDGVLWAGSTPRGGLLRFKDGKFSRLTSKQGLPPNVIISQILEDKRGRLWFGTQHGVYCVAKSALHACADGKVKRLDYVTYGTANGLPDRECSEGYQPSCWAGSDGRFWFSTIKGVASVNPDELTTRAVPPPVIIEELKADREKVELGGYPLVILPGHKQFEFRYTALNFDAPEKTRFRYRVDGFDDDWVEAGTRRVASYGNLPAGEHRFRVIACDSEGTWNEPGAELAFTLQPYFYETRWFLVLMSGLALTSVALAVRSAAARKYRRELARLEQQHAIERDRARIAKDIHDDIGAGLTQITLLSELARREPDLATGHLDRITESARNLTRAMDEIVWAVDPQHDTFSGLMDYVSAFAEDFLRMAGIRCRMDLPNALPEMPVDAELRYHLFLALKEALNNIVKHSHATEVWLRLRIEPKAFTLMIEDNGQGLPTAGNGTSSAIGGDRIASGSGLSNLESRLAAVGGRCVVQSTPREGTRVEMTLAINGHASPIVGIGVSATDDNL
jgi:signal transduction histidine kinase/ligand-binding sensor domain-containing protein